MAIILCLSIIYSMLTNYNPISIIHNLQEKMLRSQNPTPGPPRTTPNSSSQPLTTHPITPNHLKMRPIRISRHTDAININYRLRPPVVMSPRKECKMEIATDQLDEFGDGDVKNIRDSRLGNSGDLELADQIKNGAMSRKQLATSSQKSQFNVQFYQLNNRYKIHSNKKPLKSPISLFSTSHKISNSLAISMNNQISESPRSQALPVSIKFKGLGLTNQLPVLGGQEKYEPYFKRRRQFQQDREKEKVEPVLHTVSAFDRIQNHYGEKSQKQPETIPHPKPQPQHQLYYAQSIKNKRPYNEDRYICITKHLPTIRQQFHYIQNKIIATGSSSSNLEDKDKNKEKEYSFNNDQRKYWLFGVFDGHGGAKCSEFLKEQFNAVLCVNKSLFMDPELALRETFSKLQQKFLSLCDKGSTLQTSGSCAIICLLTSQKIYIGNVGDSRAYLLSPSSLKQLTKDHKPDDKTQKARIIKHGGKLYKDGSVPGALGKENIKIFGQTRIMPGSLNVSRTIGDIEVKCKRYGGAPGIVIAEPDVFAEEGQREYEHLLLASDGLFEGLSNQEIHSIYKQAHQNNRNPKQQNEETFVKSLTKQLMREASKRSNDNITVISVKLPKRLNQF